MLGLHGQPGKKENSSPKRSDSIDHMFLARICSIQIDQKSITQIFSISEKWFLSFFIFLMWAGKEISSWDGNSWIGCHSCV